ncbi:unnamed protein product [Darwinula stevensoni]|uniref:DNA polymerase theta n=1 Tax=Darwinula stevensoni TaxID=69355 RepID=A0A7R8X487_9CRUS|nr:unnamed protein product [Darwinula stevensoni]CAG0883209.1 unnamed protein product [Darwinula stevensoni]
MASVWMPHQLTKDNKAAHNNGAKHIWEFFSNKGMETFCNKLNKAFLQQAHSVQQAAAAMPSFNYVEEKHQVGVQIVGMSATLPNLDILASWISADLYKTDFRPVPLTEIIKIGSGLYDKNLCKVAELSVTMAIKNDQDHLVQLCLETVAAGHSVLVFCPTKAWCENLADNVSKEFYSLGKDPDGYAGKSEKLRKSGYALRQNLSGEKLREILEALKKTPAGLDSILGKTVPFGIAFHHAGLTFDERDIVEGAFRQNVIKVLVATSTLSSGVNLPARRVIVRSPIFHGKLIDTLSYQQMIGRAGRKGVDTQGESILVCRDNEATKAAFLMNASLEPVTSSLGQEGQSLTSSLKRAILEVIVSGAATTPADVQRYASCTLLVAQLTKNYSSSSKAPPIASCIQFLEDNEFIRFQELRGTENGQLSASRYVATPLGQAVLAASLSPDEGLQLMEELQRAMKNLVLENELHLLYQVQVTPFSVSNQWPTMDWLNYLTVWEALPAQVKRVGELVGVEERFLVRAMKGSINPTNLKQAKQLRIHQRFFTTLALNDLVNEVNLAEVARKYSCSKGLLQSLQQSAATYAGMVTVFCNKLGWTNLELLLSQFQVRLHFGVARELCDLLKVSLLNASRARWLYDAGMHSLSDLANAAPEDVEMILCNAGPFLSEKAGEATKKQELLEQAALRTIWVTGRPGLTVNRAAKLLVQEARDIIQKELGIEAAKWLEPSSTTTVKEQKAFLPLSKKRHSGELQSPEVTLRKSPRLAALSTPLMNHENLPTVIRRKKGSSSGKVRKGKKSQQQHKHTSSLKLNSSRNCPPKSDHVKDNEKSVDMSHDFFAQESEENEARQKIYEQNSNEQPKETPTLNLNSSRNCLLKPDLKQNKGKSVDVSPDLFSLDSEQYELRQKISERQDTGFVSAAQYHQAKAVGMHSVSKKLEEVVGGAPLGTAHEDCAMFDGSWSEVSFAIPVSTIRAPQKAQVEQVQLKSHKGGRRSDDLFNSQSPESSVSSITSLETNNRISEKASMPSDSKGTEYSIQPGSCQLLEETIKKPPAHKDDTLTDSFFERAFKTYHASIETPKGITCTISKKPTRVVASTPLGSMEDYIPVKLMESPFLTPGMEQVLHQLEQRFSTPVVDTVKKKTQRTKNATMENTDDDIIASSQPSLISYQRSDNFASPTRSQKREDQREVDCSVLKSRNMLKKDYQPDRDESHLEAAQKFFVVDTCSDRKLWESFLQESKNKSALSLSIACEIIQQAIQARRIGLRKHHGAPQSTLAMAPRGMPLTESDQIVGISFFWGGKDAYYVTLLEENAPYVHDSEVSWTQAAFDTSITQAERIAGVIDILKSTGDLITLDSKNVYKALIKGIGVGPQTLGRHLLDPKVGDWLLDPGTKDSSLQQLVMKHCPGESSLLGLIKTMCGVGSIGLNARNKGTGRLRATVESVLSWHMMRGISESICSLGLSQVFREIEMKSIRCLGQMELAGIGFSGAACEAQASVMQAKLAALEKEAFQLAGRNFCLSSPDDVSKVNDMNRTSGAQPVARNVLTSGSNPQIPSDFLKIVSYNTNDCIWPVLAVSRVTMHEPNLQNVPKDFQIQITDALLNSSGVSRRGLESPTKKAKKLLETSLGGLVKDVEGSSPFVVSMRHSFLPGEGCLFLSADYSQLELRLLAHLAIESQLINILNKGIDVFKAVTAHWMKISVSEVTDELRAQGKQLVYGIIYGMGTKALAEQMGVEKEEDALIFMTNFKQSFPEIQKYMEDVMTKCRKKGYVETIFGRRRYLPNINSSSPQARAQSERQALNTTVQGSAADLVKKAMVAVDKALKESFGHNWMDIKKARGARLVLQLHDELIYEVAANDLIQVAQLVKEEMEGALQLRVKLPVRLKVGASWALLRDLVL